MKNLNFKSSPARYYAVVWFALLFACYDVHTQVRRQSAQTARSIQEVPGIRVKTVWYPASHSDMDGLVWVDNRQMVGLITEDDKQKLLLYPSNKRLLGWQLEQSLNTWSLLSFKSSPLRYSASGLMFQKNDRIMKALLYRSPQGLLLGKLKTVVDLHRLAARMAHSQRYKEYRETASFRWSAIRGHLLYSLATPAGPYRKIKGLKCADGHYISAISDDCQALLIRTSIGPEVWHIDPLTDRVLWKRKAQWDCPEDTDCADFIDWDAKQGAAVITYSHDTAGANSVIEVVTRTSNRTIYDPYNNAEQRKMFPDEARWFGGGVVFAGVARNQTSGEEHNQLGYWNSRTNKIYYPAWGQEGQPLAVSPRRDQLAFITQKSAQNIPVLVVIQSQNHP
jgi:hypothetical protein